MESKSEGEGAGGNGRVLDEEQGEQQPAQTQLPSSSAGAQAIPIPPASTITQSVEKAPASSAHVSPAKSTSTTNTKAKSSREKKKKKQSFFSKLFQTLVPCVGSSHNLDVDADNNSAAPLREKQRDEEKKEKAPEASTTSIDHGHSAEASTVTAHVPIVVPPIVVPSQHVEATPPPPADDSNNDNIVIVPPSPSKRLPEDETAGVTSGAVQPPGSTGTDDHEADQHSDRSDETYSEDEDPGILSPNVGGTIPEDDFEDEEERLIMNGGAGIPIGPDGQPRPLLPPVAPHHAGRKCLVLDLDETLVHSSFKLIPQADYVVPVEIEWQWHNVYVIKRPGVDNFLKQMGELYEVVVFTASLSKYADPVLDKLDIHKVVSHRLFRESCYNHKGNYVKDLSQLGRPAADTIILDNSPASYIFHPNNAVPVSSWFNDPHDTELTDLVPFLTDLRLTDDVRGVLDGGL
ncbi:hypothetical protein M422DRAFT_175127 [Sphaerobolus stellatus SS14]|uniref:FCP1 homology domain-containing protein n=1 Tax=Sphaerobolus stellatus (strain SS14) TaxID=990650 RepID=A0A0C9VN96_SPHS4|nr:hypothetical protein M422DRAFT_175127 [Sphaerobolus stellatus SS14]